MNEPLSNSSPEKLALSDAAVERLAVVAEELQVERKTLRRDWEQLQPRERSEQSRRVKVLEEEEQRLLDEIEMNHLL